MSLKMGGDLLPPFSLSFPKLEAQDWQQRTITRKDAVCL